MDKITRRTYCSPALRLIGVAVEHALLLASGADEAGSGYDPENDLGELS